MSMIYLFLIALSLSGLHCEDYQSFYFKDKVNILSFAFSEREECLVVNQNGRTDQGANYNLPNCIYNKGKKGYQRSEQTGFVAVPRDLNWYDANPINRIQISKKCDIILTVYDDNTIRIYQRANQSTLLIQKLNYSESPQSFRLSWDGNFIVVSVGIRTKVYRWSGNQFNLFHQTSFLSPTGISAGGQLIIGGLFKDQIQIIILQDNAYKNESLKFTTAQYSQLYAYSYRIGQQDNSEIYTIIVQTQDKQHIKAYLHFQFNMTALQLNFVQSIKGELSSSMSYLTQNGKYFAYLYNSQQLFVYGKKEGKFEFIRKFWNFTQNPSDIYISQEMYLVAIASRLGPSDSDKIYSKGQQISFFYTCKEPNCKHCNVLRTCVQCQSGYEQTQGRCIEQMKESADFPKSEPKKQISQNGTSDVPSIKQQFDKNIVILALLVLITLASIYYFLKIIQKLCELCNKCLELRAEDKKKSLARMEETSESRIISQIYSENK